MKFENDKSPAGVSADWRLTRFEGEGRVGNSECFAATGVAGFERGAAQWERMEMSHAKMSKAAAVAIRFFILIKDIPLNGQPWAKIVSRRGVTA